MQSKDLDILLGVLGSPEDGIRVGFAGCWTLAVGSGIHYEVLCRHENWNEFMKLVLKYSDYVEGE